MKMLVYMLDLKNDGAIDAYVARHANIEPAVPRKLKELGVLHNRVCRLGTRLVNIIIAEDDYTSDVLKAYTDDPVCRAWDDEMAKYQKCAPGSKLGELWALTDVVYLFDQIGLQ
jgi:L-rhamnose mutarotase